jgi:hypothetical protein
MDKFNNLYEQIMNEKKVLSSKAEWMEWARRLTEAYEARPVLESSIKSSYDALNASNHKMYKQILSRVDVEFVDDDPYQNYKTMEDQVFKTKKLKIYKGGSKHPFFSEEDNWIFRTVHDYLGHLAGKFSFSLQGELSAYNKHVRIAPVKARPALFCEVPCQIAYYYTRKSYVPVQKACHLYGFDFVNIGVINEEEYQKNFK